MASAQLIRDVILRDGSTLRLRTPSPADFDDIKAFYDALSPDSRYLRFHGYGRTDTAARDYAEADGVDRMALIGHHSDRVVAAAGYDRLREPAVAEVAFAVAEDFHGSGTATRMLEQLAEIAAGRGIQRFDAEVMADNNAMLRVFKRAGFGLRRTGGFGEVVVSLDIRPTEAVKERIEERDHRAAVASLRPILAPRSIAVVGAFSEPGSLSAAVLANIVAGGFTGVAAPVSRSGGVVQSMRVAPSLGALDEAPELVVIAAPAAEVLDVASEAAQKGSRALMVLSAGFAEDGEEGRAREERLLEIVRSGGLRMVGPNCLGVRNTDPAVSLDATLARSGMREGRLAICSQSGAIGIGLLGHAEARGLGVSSFASLGNRADVSTNDLLELWEEDARTSAVMLYLGTFGNPQRFTRIARRAARRKPLLAVKGHRTPPPTLQARSHTAAALSGDAVVDALLRQAGVLRFLSGEELFNAAEFFASQPLPRGRRIAIVSNSAGVATLAHDACATRQLLAGDASRVLGIQGEPDDYTAAVRALLDDEGIDAVMAYYVDLSGGRPRAVLQAISEAAKGDHKPVVASVVRADGHLPDPSPGCVPNFLFPESCAAVLARAAERRDWLSRPLGQRPRHGDLDPEAARARVSAWLEREPGRDGDQGDRWLPTAEAEALLATHSLPFVTSLRCPAVDDAVAAARSIRAPIALKADFPPPAHAGDVGAVLLGLRGAAAVQAGWQELERRVRSAGHEWLGAVVQPLVAPGADVLVGAITDPDLGPVMAIGLGGRQAGLAPDVAFRLLPVTDVDARELIDAAGGVATQLDGFRGGVALDRDALGDLILRFAALLREVPELVEVDLNPVRCMQTGCAVLDLRLRAERPRPAPRVKTW